MEYVFHALAACRGGLADLVTAPFGLPAALFLAGLGGSVLHCTGMCGPFVLGQVMADARTATAAHYGEWRRLSGAALLPYHLGRATTYTLLGTVAGAVTGLFASTPVFGWLAGGLLLLAALLMLAQALGLAAGVNSPFSAGLTRLAGPLAASRGAAARYALGVVLGFLRCALLYGALAAAGGSGSAATGAMSMAAFAAGTMPALIVVGWLGAIARRRLLNGTARWVAVPLLLANAALMTVLATQRL